MSWLAYEDQVTVDPLYRDISPAEGERVDGGVFMVPSLGVWNVFVWNVWNVFEEFTTLK